MIALRRFKDVMGKGAVSAMFSMYHKWSFEN